MKEALIVSPARTQISKAFRGACNNTPTQTLVGHSVRHAAMRASLDGPEIDDCAIGAALQESPSGFNIAHQAVIRAKLPIKVAGMSVDCQCAPAIATAAKQIVHDGMSITIGGGGKSISLVQTATQRQDWAPDHRIEAHVPSLYMSMLEGPETVAERYGVTREAQDDYALLSQPRTAAATKQGRFDAEIVPFTSTKIEVDKEAGEKSKIEVTLWEHEGNRPGATFENRHVLKPVSKNGLGVARGNYGAAGNASQLSDGASASVLMEANTAEKFGTRPLVRDAGMSVASLGPDEMGIGPIHAVPRLLRQHNLSVDDFDLWKFNEAFARRVLHSAEIIRTPL
jgi:acetyl-CoA C-acetyltransferase